MAAKSLDIHSGALGNGGLLNIRHVHNDAAFEHFGEAGFETEGGGVGTVVLGHELNPWIPFRKREG